MGIAHLLLPASSKHIPEWVSPQPSPGTSRSVMERRTKAPGPPTKMPCHFRGNTELFCIAIC